MKKDDDCCETCGGSGVDPNPSPDGPAMDIPACSHCMGEGTEAAASKWFELGI